MSISMSAPSADLSTSPPITLSLPSVGSLSLPSSSNTRSRPTGIPLSLASTVLSLSSATVPTSYAPTASQTSPAFECPYHGDQVVEENGYQWVIGCANDTTGAHYSSQVVSDSFNDCFLACDQSSTNTGANYCTAFTFIGGDVDGTGPGICYLKSDVAESTIPAGRNYVAGVRLVNFAGRAAAGTPLNSYPALPSTEAGSLSLSMETNSMSLPGNTPTPSISLDSSVPVNTDLTALSTTTSPAIPASVPTTSLSIETSMPGGLTSPLPSGTPSVSASLSASVDTNAVGSITTNSPSICANGGDPLNLCIIATATGDGFIGASGGVGVGVSSSTLLGAGVDLGLSLSLSLGLSAGLGVSTGPGGIGLSGTATLGAGIGADATGGVSLTLPGLPGLPGLGGAGSSPSTTVLTVTTVQTTFTVTSCTTGLGGVLTCPGSLIAGGSTFPASTSIATASCSTGIGGLVTCATTQIVLPISAPTTTTTSFTTRTTTTTTTSSSTTRTTTSTTTTACNGVMNNLGICASALACIPGLTC